MTDRRATKASAEGVSLGATVEAATLESDPYAALAMLREHEPVSWIPALGGWLITRRDLAVTAMRDATAFTVDDPRFTTAAVLGPSMLSLDGTEHARHRQAFAPHFRPSAVRDADALVTAEAERLVNAMKADGSGELRTQLAGPLAVTTICAFLGLGDLDPDEVLGWYTTISNAIVAASIDQPSPPGTPAAVAELRRTIIEGTSRPDTLLRTVSDEAILHPEEIPSEAAVVMFGAIETSEGMTANALWHLLTNPDTLAAVTADRSLLAPIIEESLRLEPAAATIDRYATTDVSFGGAEINAGDLVSISLLGANRDPAVFAEPDCFDPSRANLGQHVSFVQGPHGCIGVHLARLETRAALTAVLDRLRDLSLDIERSAGPEGLVFRKPRSVTARWSASTGPAESISPDRAGSGR